MKKKGIYIVIGLVVLTLIGYLNSEDYKNSKKEHSKPTQSEKSNTNQSTINNTGKVTYDGNGNKIKSNKKSVFNLDDIEWSLNFSKSEIQGNWLQVLWYDPQNNSDKTYYKDGDDEQRTLVLTENSYQTSTEIGGANPKFNCEIKNGRLIVTTNSKLASEVFNYKIELSKDKKILKLTGDYEAKVYKKK